MTALSSQEFLAQFLRQGEGAAEYERGAPAEDELRRGHKYAARSLPVWMVDEPSPFSSPRELENFLASLADLPNDPEVLQARRYANDLLERHHQIVVRRRN